MRLKPSRSASPSIDYPSGAVVAGCLSPYDKDDPEPAEQLCEECGADLTSEHGPAYPYSCPSCMGVA